MSEQMNLNYGQKFQLYQALRDKWRGVSRINNALQMLKDFPPNDATKLYLFFDWVANLGTADGKHSVKKYMLEHPHYADSFAKIQERVAVIKQGGDKANIWNFDEEFWQSLMNSCKMASSNVLYSLLENSHDSDLFLLRQLKQLYPELIWLYDVVVGV